MSAKHNRKPIPGNGQIAKLIASLVLILGAAGIAATQYGMAVPISQTAGNISFENRYLWLNVGAVLIILQVLQAFNLKRLQKGAYWFFWLQLKKTELDERQKAVRQRVFERAYAYAIVLSIVVTLYLTGGGQRFIAAYDPVFKSDPLTPAILWAMIITLVSLPSVIAAWQKDS